MVEEERELLGDRRLLGGMGSRWGLSMVRLLFYSIYKMKLIYHFVFFLFFKNFNSVIKAPSNYLTFNTEHKRKKKD